jgi:adenine deaminase
VERGPVARLRRVIAAARGEAPADLVLRLETSGGRIDARAVRRLLTRSQVLGLAEVME